MNRVLSFLFFVGTSVAGTGNLSAQQQKNTTVTPASNATLKAQTVDAAQASETFQVAQPVPASAVRTMAQPVGSLQRTDSAAHLTSISIAEPKVESVTHQGAFIAAVSQPAVTSEEDTWQVIEAKDNKAFNGNEKNQSLINILIQGVLAGNIKAYDPAVPGFVKELTKEEFVALAGPQNTGFNPKEVSCFRIYETTMPATAKKKAVTSITGLAPERVVADAQGNKIKQVLFKIDYNSSRAYLAKYKAINDPALKNMTWAQVLDGRKFKSKKAAMNR